MADPGGGKSSLAKAGVLPMLMQPGVVEGVDQWRYAVFKPGEAGGDLILALCGALVAPHALPSLGSAAELAQELRAAPELLVALVSSALDAAGPGTRLALRHGIPTVHQCPRSPTARLTRPSSARA